MTDRPITQAQLNGLEAAADKVFSKLGIDIEFTRHFLDRVNDERNRTQITIKELGMLFAKEYKKWGRKIATMPVDAEAVMKDLSSEINIPFVLNKDGKEKDLVAKTVMRKKDFKSPDPALPVESVNEENHSELYYVQPDGKWKKGADGRSKGLKRSELPTDAVIAEDSVCWDGYEKVPGKKNYEKGSCRKKTTEEKHGAKKGSQVKGKEPTPKTSKPSRTGEQKHPMHGRLVGEQAVQAAWESYQVDEDVVDPRQAVLMKALNYLDSRIKQDGNRQSIGGYAFDVGREINLGQIGINAKDLAQLYRDWKGTTPVTEGWMEKNLYYLDEVIDMEEKHSESKGQKQVNETKTERRKKAKK